MTHCACVIKWVHSSVLILCNHPSFPLRSILFTPSASEKMLPYPNDTFLDIHFSMAKWIVSTFRIFDGFDIRLVCRLQSTHFPFIRTHVQCKLTTISHRVNVCPCLSDLGLSVLYSNQKRWVAVLSAEYPTLAFHASLTNSFGKGSLIQLLRQFGKVGTAFSHTSPPLHTDRTKLPIWSKVGP